MNEKILSITLIVLSSVLALVFMFMNNFNLAVLFMTLLFMFSNFFRYRSFKEKGMKKEAKWMLTSAGIFAVLFLIVLFVVVL